MVNTKYFDEKKTNPKPNPLTGGKSYFSNKRSQRFQKEFKRLCKENNVVFIDVGVSEEEWMNKYIYEDGLHANKSGHELIAGKLMKEIKKVLSSS